jgi:hypothetical protein
MRVDVHASWVSDTALELTIGAHGGKLPETVEGGDIIRHDDGTETGKKSIFI